MIFQRQVIVSIKEPRAILVKEAKSFFVRFVLPSAIFNGTEVAALLN